MSEALNGIQKYEADYVDEVVEKLEARNRHLEKVCFRKDDEWEARSKVLKATTVPVTAVEELITEFEMAAYRFHKMADEEAGPYRSRTLAANAQVWEAALVDLGALLPDEGSDGRADTDEGGACAPDLVRVIDAAWEALAYLGTLPRDESYGPYKTLDRALGTFDVKHSDPDWEWTWTSTAKLEPTYDYHQRLKAEGRDSTAPANEIQAERSEAPKYHSMFCDCGCRGPFDAPSVGVSLPVVEEARFDLVACIGRALGFGLEHDINCNLEGNGCDCGASNASELLHDALDALEAGLPVSLAPTDERGEGKPTTGETTLPRRDLVDRSDNPNEEDAP